MPPRAQARSPAPSASEARRPGLPGERATEARQGQDELHGDGQWPEFAGLAGEQGDGAEEQDGHRAQNDSTPGRGRRPPVSATLRLQHHVVKSAFQRSA